MSAQVNDRELAVARVYAESLLALAEERDAGDRVLEELRGLVALQDRDPDLERFFSSPLVAQDARSRTIDKTLQDEVSPLVVDALQVMNGKGRLGLLRALAVAYRQALDEKRGRVDVAVTSAVPLTDSNREKLRETLARVTGRQVRLAETVDSETLGGLIVSVGDRKIDYSLASDLRRLNDQLLDRATREIHFTT